MKILQLADSVRFRTMTTRELRQSFLVTNLFQVGKISLVYIDLDRTIVGSAVPSDGPLQLLADDELKSSYFNQRRELGILNIGGAGHVTADSARYQLQRLDALYLGRGIEQIEFSSLNAEDPAEFYLLSYPAHVSYPAQFIASSNLNRVKLGAAENANLREITKLIHMEGVRSCQLVMGFTQLASGNVWNTMPPHTHMRRSEVYLYFDLAPADRVLHLMGPPAETRTLVLSNKQVAISPGWSIHAGVGTSSYTFCWGMGGENQDYNDMDRVAAADLL